MSIFFAFPSQPLTLDKGYRDAAATARQHPDCPQIRLWTELDVIGQPLWRTISSEIQQSAGVCADISALNPNVVFEVGYAIGLRKPIFLLINASLPDEGMLRTRLGFFDVLGRASYHDEKSLASIIRGCAKRPQPVFVPEGIDNKAPVFLVDSSERQGLSARIKSRVKERIVFFRSFDPHETVRFPLDTAITEIARSLGVIVYLIPHNYPDSHIHNLRSSFIGGLASGLGKSLLFISIGQERVPLDYRDVSL